MISLVHAIEGKHGYTRGHSQRVAEISANLARDLGLPPERIEKIRQAALVHDIGKIWVSNDLLNKTSCLTSEEMQHVRRHPETGEFILRRVVNDGDILRLVRNHHERYDGTGYPDKIQGEQIPIEVGIIALADAYDATQFDPRVVDAFLKSSTGDNSCFSK